jgi:hypothetical protein
MRRKDQKNRTRIGPHLRQPQNAESRVISVAKIGYVRRSEFSAASRRGSACNAEEWNLRRSSEMMAIAPRSTVLRDNPATPWQFEERQTRSVFASTICDLVRPARKDLATKHLARLAAGKAVKKAAKSAASAVVKPERAPPPAHRPRRQSNCGPSCEPRSCAAKRKVVCGHGLDPLPGSRQVLIPPPRSEEGDPY